MGNEIIEWAKKNEVLLVKGTESGETISMYKDAIHYNEKGTTSSCQYNGNHDHKF